MFDFHLEQARGFCLGTSQEKAIQTRQEIIAAATRLFQERGFDAVGIADIMGSIGLTNGGFYRHFSSKSALAAEVTRDVFERTRLRWKAILNQNSGGALEALLDDYLRLENVGGNLTPSVFGHATSVDAEREVIGIAYSTGMTGLAEILAGVNVDPTKTQAKRLSLSTLAAMLGALAIARGMRDPSAAREMLMATRSQLLQQF